MRSHSLPGFGAYQDPRNPQFRHQERNFDPRYIDPRYSDLRNGDLRYPEPRRAAEAKKSNPRSSEPRVVASAGQKKISDKPRDDAQRSKSTNREQTAQEQKPSSGLKIPMQRKIASDNPQKSPNPNRSGSRDWGPDPFYPDNERGKINPFYQESGFSDNFVFKYPDQPQMSADRYF